MKKCNKCNEEKSFSEFYKHKRYKYGLGSQCKNCIKKYKDNNKNKIKETSKLYYKNNREKILQYSKSYILKNREKIKIYKEKNKEKIKETSKIYKEKNKEKILKYRREYESIKKKENTTYKFKHNVRTLIGGCFKRNNNDYKKNAKTEQILGCTIEEFRSYISLQFKTGMSFENHGEWHLDHIYPISLATTEEEVIKLNHYSNFQPLWAKDNLIKGNKIVNKN
jgi:hypothetical protein